MNHEELIREIERREYYNELAPFPVYDTDIINDLKKLNMLTEKDNFNNEKITYCKTCLSIKIKTIELKDTDKKVDYCIDCSNTPMGEAHISEWEDLYEERYGERFLTKNKK
jgi:hypothetical protein